MSDATMIRKGVVASFFLTPTRSGAERMPIMEADKGYDAQWLRQKLLKRGLFPAIPFRQFAKSNVERPKFADVCSAFGFTSCRWVVERTFSWIKRQSRRLLMRWERKQALWEAMLKLGQIRYWLKVLFG